MASTKEKLTFIFIVSAVLIGVQCQSNMTRLPPPDRFVCEPITEIPLCSNVGYSNATFPNVRNHMSQLEANRELNNFLPLISSNCSNASVIFLCSIYAPICNINFPAVRLSPCKNLCEYVRHGCENLLLQYNIEWPEHLNCDHLPEDLCFGPEDPSAIQPPTPTNTSPPPEHDFVCEPITEIPLCSNVGYSNATFPNFRNQTSQSEANRELNSFLPLIGSNCSDALVIFLCSIYAPFCDINFPCKRLPPCKNLCEYVRHGCEDLLLQYGIEWPEHLNCDHISSGQEDLCFGPEDPSAIQPPTPPNTSHPPAPTNIQFTEGSPSVEGDTVHVEFQLNWPASVIQCQLLPISSRKQNCSNGSISYSGVPPGSYTLRVVAQYNESDRVVWRRKIKVLSMSTECAVNVTEVYTSCRNVTVNFNGIGPVNRFSCSVNQASSHCESPWELSQLEEGEHQLEIMPRGKRCTQKTPYTTTIILTC